MLATTTTTTTLALRCGGGLLRKGGEEQETVLSMCCETYPEYVIASGDAETTNTPQTLDVCASSQVLTFDSKLGACDFTNKHHHIVGGHTHAYAHTHTVYVYDKPSGPGMAHEDRPLSPPCTLGGSHPSHPEVTRILFGVRPCSRKYSRAHVRTRSTARQKMKYTYATTTTMKNLHVRMRMHVNVMESLCVRRFVFLRKPRRRIFAHMAKVGISRIHIMYGTRNYVSAELLITTRALGVQQVNCE